MEQGQAGEKDEERIDAKRKTEKREWEKEICENQEGKKHKETLTSDEKKEKEKRKKKQSVCGGGEQVELFRFSHLICV